MRLLSKRSLGISISDGHAAFAEVEKGLGQVRLVRSGTFPLPPGTDQLHGHPEVAESAPVRERKLGRLRSRPGPTEVIVGVAQSALVLRFIELPDVDDAGLEGLVSYELERHLPFPPEEACYSFQKLRRNGNRAQILLVAARRADVERTIAPVEQMGLTPTAVDVSSIAATNALFFHQRHRADEVLSLIEVNGGDAAVNVVSQGVLVSSRTVPLVDGSFSPLFSELKRVSEAVPQAPGKILVCGGTEELCLRLKEEMGVPVEQWSPGSSAVDASAFGLALKGLVKLPIQIDLLPAERKVKRRERVVVAMFALLATVGVLGLAWGISAASLERRTLSQLDQQLAGIKAEAAAVDGVKAEFATLRARLQLLEGLVEVQGRPLLVLKELVRLLPSDVTLTELSLTGNKVKIRGSTSTSASALISAFERSSLFENAAFTSPISARGKDREAFQIEASIKGRTTKGDRGRRRGGRR